MGVKLPDAPFGGNRGQVLYPSVKVKLHELDIVCLEASRLYRGLPPKHDGRIMRAALDPFWQCLSGDLNPVRNLMIISADAFKVNDMRLLCRCIKQLKRIENLLKSRRGNNVSTVYRIFFRKKVRLVLSKAMLWKELLVANGLRAPVTKSIGPRLPDKSFIKIHSYTSMFY